MEDDSLEMSEEFDNWNKVKMHLELHGRQPNPAQGEIWWAGVGRNLGSEINGKNEVFSRPILIYKKLSRYKYMAVPLTSKEHIGSWYVNFVQNGKNQTAVLSDARIMSIKRLYSRLGKVDESDMQKIRQAFIELYS